MLASRVLSSPLFILFFWLKTRVAFSMSKIASETVLQTSASLEKAYEFSDKLNEYLRSAHSCLRVRFIEYIYDGKYACFDVLGHAPWPDIDKCKEIGQVTVADQTHLHASGADLDFGFHGTHPSNAFSILQFGGFDIDYSGDAPAGVCTVPKFNASYVYDHGAVLHCSIHGVLLAINTPSRKRAFDTWAGRYIPIGANPYNKHRGSPLGQVMSHPGNSCISIVEENFVALKPTLPNSNDFRDFISQDVKNADNECPPHIASTREDSPSDPDIQRSWVFIDFDDEYSSVTVGSDIEGGFVVC